MAQECNSSILIIEDDKETADTLALLLERVGYDVSVSTGGEEGLGLARGEKPDMVILDVMMPEKDGLEVMEEMRRDPATREIPILFLSALKDEETIVKGLRGADDYVTKPFNFLELRERVRNICERSRAERPAADAPEPSIDRIPVKIGKETFLIPFRELYYVEASGRYCYVHTRSKKFLADFSIGEMEERLEGQGHFFRVHRSFIANFDHILKIRKDSPQRLVLVLTDESRSQLPISNTYYPKVKGLLGI